MGEKEAKPIDGRGREVWGGAGSGARTLPVKKACSKRCSTCFCTCVDTGDNGEADDEPAYYFAARLDRRARLTPIVEAPPPTLLSAREEMGAQD